MDCNGLSLLFLQVFLFTPLHVITVRVFHRGNGLRNAMVVVQTIGINVLKGLFIPKAWKAVFEEAVVTHCAQGNQTRKRLCIGKRQIAIQSTFLKSIPCLRLRYLSSGMETSRSYPFWSRVPFDRSPGPSCVYSSYVPCGDPCRPIPAA